MVRDLVEVGGHADELTPVVTQLGYQLVHATHVHAVTRAGRVQRAVHQDLRHRLPRHLGASLQQSTLLLREVHRQALTSNTLRARATTTIQTRPARYDAHVVCGARHRNHLNSCPAQRPERDHTTSVPSETRQVERKPT